jgi:hypothetical protein
MKTRLLFSVFLFSVMLVQAQQIVWTYTNLSESKGYMGSTSLGDKAYFAGGNNGSGSIATVEAYDVTTGTWDIIGDLFAAREVVSAVACGSKVLFAGGFDWTVSYDLVDIYDTETSQWTVAQLSVPRFSMAGVSNGDKVLFAGGFQFPQQIYWDVVDIFDCQTQSWATTYLSIPREGIAAAIVGDLAIFAGGKNFQGTTAVVDIYHFSTGEWSTDFLSQARGFASATTVGNKVIIAGGITSLNNPTDRVDIYDASTGTWEDTQSLSVPRASQGNAATVNDLAYFAGGGNFMGSGYYAPSDVVDIYDPKTATWTVDYLPQPIVAHSVVNVGSYFIVAGGKDDQANEVSNVSIADLGVGIQGPAVVSPQSAVVSYPNPTNSISHFTFRISQYQNMTLKVYDVQGREVAVVLDQEMDAGEHTVQWDASSLPAGIYYYRLTTDDYRLTTCGKLIIAR